MPVMVLTIGDCELLRFHLHGCLQLRQNADVKLAGGRSERDWFAGGSALGASLLGISLTMYGLGEGSRVLVPFVTAGALGGLLSVVFVPWANVPTSQRVPTGAKYGLRAGGLATVLVGGFVLLGSVLIAPDIYAVWIAFFRTLLSISLLLLPGLLSAVVVAMATVRIVAGNSSDSETEPLTDESFGVPFYKRPAFALIVIAVLSYVGAGCLVGLKTGLFAAAEQREALTEDLAMEAAEPVTEIVESTVTAPLEEAKPTPPFYSILDGLVGASASEIEIVKKLEFDDLQSLSTIVMSPDSTRLAYHSTDRSHGVRVFDLHQNRLIREFSVFASRMKFAWAQDSSQVFFVDDNRRTGVMQLDAGRLVYFPLPEPELVPTGQPAWWSEKEVVFYPGMQVLNLDTLQMKSIGESAHWNGLDKRCARSLAGKRQNYIGAKRKESELATQRDGTDNGIRFRGKYTECKKHGLERRLAYRSDEPCVLVDKRCRDGRRRIAPPGRNRWKVYRPKQILCDCLLSRIA